MSFDFEFNGFFFIFYFFLLLGLVVDRGWLYSSGLVVDVS